MTMDEKSAHDAAPLAGDGQPVEAVTEEDAAPRRREVNGDAASGSEQPAALSTTLQRFADQALDFLSHASNETLGACLAGLGATTYLILGRIGLVIIGVAGGVVLHATWEGIRGDDRDEETKKAERERRREAGIEVAKRVLDLRPSKSSENNFEGVKMSAYQTLDFSNFEPETAQALNMFTDAVIKDYVYYWYGPTLPGEESFPASCRRTLTAFMLSLSGHLQRKRPADAFLVRMLMVKPLLRHSEYLTSLRGV